MLNLHGTVHVRAGYYFESTSRKEDSRFASVGICIVPGATRQVYNDRQLILILRKDWVALIRKECCFFVFI